MAQEASEYEIKGTVKGREGETLRHARVVVWWQQIRQRRELAATETSDEGKYHLRYRLPEKAPQPVKLVVEAISDFLNAPLFSPVTTAQQSLTIDLAFEAADQSEWAVLLRSIHPFLNGLTLNQLVENAEHKDISFLANELGRGTEAIMRLVVASRLAAEFKIAAPVFYAFLRQQVPSALPSPLLDASQNFTLIDSLVDSIASMIFGLSAQIQTQTLNSAVTLNYIGTQFSKQIPRIVDELQAQQPATLLSQTFLVGSATLSQLLNVASIPQDTQQSFAKALAANNQSMRNFWRTLDNGQSGLTAEEASSIQRVLSIGSLVKNYVPLVENLSQGFTSGTYKSLSDLARLSQQDWTNVINQTGAPPNIDAAGTATPAEVFASVIYTRVTRAYPTAALSSRISGSKFIPQQQQASLATFFGNNPDLELVKDNVAVYVANAGNNAFAGIDAADQSTVLSNARAIQRVLRLAPSPDIAQNLLDAGISSATQIANIGRQQFFLHATAAGLNGTEANEIFDAASQRYANAVSVFTQFNVGAMGIWPKAIGDPTNFNVSMQQAIVTDPTLATLFGSQDYCATDDCSSILSPAAYLCDLLLWLRNHPNGAGTVLDVLDGRRPDIRHLLLNCPNSDTELPYIDLVIELLADKVSPPPATTLSVAIDATQTSITVSSDAGFPSPNFTALIGAEIVLVTAASGVGNTVWTVTRAQQGTSGALASSGASVILTTSANPPWKQTPYSATAAQLSAAPLYFNQGAFIELFGASYPFSLPYSAGLDELRTYLEQWKLPLWQVRQALLPLNGGTQDQQAAVAAERLEMNAVAEALVSIANFVPVAEEWSTPHPETALASVAAFLQAASISYESLIELLQCSWVQNGLGVSIIGIDDTCDVDKQMLTQWTTLAANIDDAQTNITVANGSGFPAPNFYAGIGNEIVQVTATSGANNTAWTVVRGQQGTTAAAASSGTVVTIPLDDGFLDRAARFLRLWLATGYQMWELDLLLNALKVGAGALNQNTLVVMQAFWQLQQTTRLAVDQQLAFFQDLDTNAHRASDGSTTIPLYSQIFLNPTTTWIAADPDLASLPIGGPIGDPSLSDHVKGIQPALAMSASDLAALVALTDNNLTLDNLSWIYRINALAAASKFSVSNLLNVAKLLSPAAGTPSTTLAAAMAATDDSITVTSAAPFGPPDFYIQIGAESLLVTSMSGASNTTWTVLRGQLGSIAAAAANGVAVMSDSASPAAALNALLNTPATTLAFLQQAVTIQQQSGLSLDAITYLLTPPSSITGGWATTTQMTVANMSATLTAVQQAEQSLLSASTTLVSAISATDTTITVASDAGFPAPDFNVYIGTEILEVTATSGPGNATWTVVRGTPAAPANAGASVTPTTGDIDGAVIAAVAATAHTASAAPLATDVTAAILETLTVPGVGQTLLAVLMDPSLLGATGTIEIGGTPVAGDTLQVVLNNGIAPAVNVAYPLIAADVASVNQTAADFANAINLSAAVVGAQAFLAPCKVSGAVITLTPLAPGAPGSSISSANTATPGGTGHVSISPAASQTIGQPAFQNQFLALQILDKAAVLVRGLKLVITDLSWLLANSGNAAVGGIDLTSLPVTAAQSALGLNTLLNTLLLIKLARLWTLAPAASPIQSLYDIIGNLLSGTLSDEPSTQAALATITGWPLSDIQSFAAALAVTFPASYESPSTYNALRTLEAMSAAVNASGPVISGTSTSLAAPIATTVQASITVSSAIGFPAPNFYINIGTEILLVTGFGGSDNTVWSVQRGQMGTTAATAAAGAVVTPTYGAQIVTWGSVPFDEVSAESMAASALGILKAQQATEDAWLALAPNLMNPIRQNQSAALQAFLIAQRDSSDNLIFTDTNGLFDYFLIDTQMTSCQVTSRIVQAYIAVQIFVERCLMNLEAPGVVVNLNLDDTWNQWEWMSRFRVWQANREVFLYPENWLIESERPNRTEIYETFEQEVRQGPSTADYFETVVLNYIDRLDGLAHLYVTGTCEDPATGTVYAVARTMADPPVYYIRSYSGQWTGWSQIPLDIKAYHVVPAMYRGRICLFWLDVKVSNEPQQNISSPQESSNPPSQDVERYVALGVFFSIYRNETWAPAQTSRGKLFDKPLIDSTKASNARAIEALYTIKVQTPAPSPGYGANLWVDVFRYGDYNAQDIAIAEDLEQLAAELLATGSQAGGILQTLNDQLAQLNESVALSLEAEATQKKAVHVGRAVFDGRFNDLELNNLGIAIYGNVLNLYTYAQATYGPDAQPLLPLTAPDPDLNADSGLLPKSGALTGYPSDGATSPFQLNFTSAGALEQNVGPLLTTASVPLRVIGPDSNLNFDPASFFFFQDNRRCYFVEAQNLYWTGSMWSPLVPSDPSTAPFQLQYTFHPFYHPFTRLFWNQLAGGDFDLLYDLQLQQAPDSIDPSYSDVFSFQNGYQPTWRVEWDHAGSSTILAANISNTQTTIQVTDNIWVPQPAFYAYIGSEVLEVTGVSGPNNCTWTVVRGQQGTTAAAAGAGLAITPTFTSQDRQFLDFSYSGPFSVYNWELFYHIPLYVAQLLSQNQQFEDALTWFQYIFNPTRQGSDPVPQRFWIPQPLHNLTSAEIQSENINQLLIAVNEGDPTSVAQIESWRNDPFNPFLLADQRPVAYMKSTVMSYLDNLIAWGDNLFSTESREALSEATLLYVQASEILGPAPNPVPPPEAAEESFDQLEPLLDAFANAMVNIENVIGGTGGGSGSGSGGMIPSAQTFYFKIPSNPTLLNYWSTVDDRLFKLRNCQNIAGAPLELALFDAPIDPGLLIAAQAAGVDLSSVLNDVAAPLPNYRYTALYSQALDFVNAVRAYGAELLTALEKSDAAALALLQQTLQQQLLKDGSVILDWQVQRAQDAIDAATQAVALAQQKYTFNTTQPYMNDGENIAHEISKDLLCFYATEAVCFGIAGIASGFPDFILGVSGFGGTPQAGAKEGSSNVSDASKFGAATARALSATIKEATNLAKTSGSYDRRQDRWNEAAAEAQIQIAEGNAHVDSANLALQIAQQNQSLHLEQIDHIQQQIDFLTNKFTSQSLYDWMVGSLSATYFQSYQLAYQMCKQVERCYQFELGLQHTSFIEFGYWDSLHKGLLSGESLNHDLRRMQASYLQQNARRFELSRYVSLGLLDPVALQQLLITGSCNFTLPESLFDNDYPGHYNRRLTRVSMTVVYPSPGKFDNIKATLTMMSNQVRTSTGVSGGYLESPVGSDPRFVYNYAAVPQKIAMGNAQDDPGLFITAINNNIADQRYLPFENAGAVSSWNLEMPQINNEVDISTVGDVVLHLYYTALDGGTQLAQAVEANNAANLPTSGVKIFSAQNDFPAGLPSLSNPFPLTPWQALIGKPYTTFTSLAWPINATQTTITVSSDLGFPAAPFFVRIGNEVVEVTAVSGSTGTNWTVIRGQQGTAAAPATVETVVLLPASGSQILTLAMNPNKFPAWTRGKTITATSITLLAVSWQPPTAAPPGPFILTPLAPLPTASISMQPVPGATEPNICTTGPIALPPNTALGTWGFELQLQGATNFFSLSKFALGDILLIVTYNAS